MPTIPPISGRTERFVRGLRHHARWILLGALALFGLSSYLATKLELRTDFAELLPSSDPAVIELRRVQELMPGFAALVVAIDSPSKEANVRFAAAMAAGLEKLPKDVVSMVAWNLRAERAFFEANRWLFPSVEDLERIRDLFQDKLDRAKNPMLVDLSDDDGASLEDLKKKYQGQADSLGISKLPDGVFASEDGKFVAVLAIPPKGLFAQHAGERLRDEVVRLRAELDPKKYHPQMNVGFSGDVMTQIEERAALENDLIWATSICIGLVILAVMLFYGRIAAVFYMSLPMAVGTLMAFAVAKLVYGYLNSSTAFLGSIIAGGGINFAIILLARYEEERRSGVVAEVALVRAVAATWRATATASLAASISYASLIVTRFRGFSQFGVIGGSGMVFCWVATMTVLPAMLWAFDRKPRPKRPPQKHFFIDPAARLVTRHPGALLSLGAVITMAALYFLPGYIADPFEYDFRNLRNRKVEVSGEGVWSPKVHGVFGRALSPSIVIAPTPEASRDVQRAVLKADARGTGGPILSRVVTLWDLLPGDLAVQQKKLQIIDEIRAIAEDKAMKLLTDEERADVQKSLPPAGLKAFGPKDLPRLARWPFQENDGTMGRVVLVFPQDLPRYNPYNGRHSIQLAERIRQIHLEDGQLVRSTGTPVVFAGMVESIVADGPIATGVSALGVILLVVVLARGGGGWAIVLGTLFAGVIWMLGAAAAMKDRVNFLNFVALPLTLGIGVDYGINVYLRYRLEGPGRLAAALRSTGGAVVLCSFTTSIGYAGLLVADSLALRSFGKLAILGEAACLLAAAIFMPAALALWERRNLPKLREMSMRDSVRVESQAAAAQRLRDSGLHDPRDR